MHHHQLVSLHLLVAVHLAGYYSTLAINCGWPGKPNGGFVLSESLPAPPIGVLPNARSNSYVPTSRGLSYPYQFTEGQIVSYQCWSERMDVIRGSYVNRTCQGDGRWSGSRPWCDLNVAYGKSVTYAGNTGTNTGSTISTNLLTDGMADSSATINAAECVSLSRSGAYLNLDLGQNYPVRSVTVYGKEDGFLINLNNRKTTLYPPINCPENGGNKSTLIYQCQRELVQFSPNNQVIGSSIRFEHSSTFTVPICEVVVYVNPTLMDCGEPEVPANGEVTLTTTPSSIEARYNCQFGYEMFGNEIRNCYGRNWEGDQPICKEIIQPSTTEAGNSTLDYTEGGPVKTAGLDPFQIVLIVVCVSLAIGLIVALIVLLKYGRLTCCGKGVPRRYSLRKKKNKKKPSETEYQSVDQTRPTPPAQVNLLPASTVENESSLSNKNKTTEAPRNVRQQETGQVEVQDLTYVRLAFQNESRQQQQAPPALPSTPPQVMTTYAELRHEPRRSKMVNDDSSTPTTSPPGSPIYMQPIYAQVRPKSTNAANKIDSNPTVGDTIAEFPSPPVSPSAAAADADDEMNVSPPPATRKSYIPLVYLKESPEVQQKQQALNNELKEAVRVNRVTDF